MTRRGTHGAGGAELICPRCAGPMVSYERSGVVVDLCRDCRGIFLDRGEVERLVEAEAAALGPDPGFEPDPARPYGTPPAAARRPSGGWAPERWPVPRDRRDDDEDDDDARHDRSRRPGRRRGFFAELLDDLID